MAKGSGNTRTVSSRTASSRTTSAKINKNITAEKIEKALNDSPGMHDEFMIRLRDSDVKSVLSSILGEKASSDRIIEKANIGYSSWSGATVVEYSIGKNIMIRREIEPGVAPTEKYSYSINGSDFKTLAENKYGFVDRPYYFKEGLKNFVNDLKKR